MTDVLASPGLRKVPAALRTKRRRDRLQVLAFLSPWLIGFSLFFAYPLLATVYYSFMHYDLISTPTFVGLRNWRFLFTQDNSFLTALRNTLWLVVVMVPARVIFGLAVGMLVVKLKTGAKFFRTVFYLPYLAPPVAATIGFVFLLNPATGPVNTILAKVGIHAPNWFNDEHWSKPALTLLAIWGIGDLMVIFMAALLDVPAEMYEAAAIDGANAWQRFRYITLPTIQPVVLFAAITGTIITLQYYTQAWVAGTVASGVTLQPGTQTPPGYPHNSTLTITQLVYDSAFRQFQMGYACALALVLFAISMFFTAFLLRRRSGFRGDD